MRELTEFVTQPEMIDHLDNTGIGTNSTGWEV